MLLRAFVRWKSFVILCLLGMGSFSRSPSLCLSYIRTQLNADISKNTSKQVHTQVSDIANDREWGNCFDKILKCSEIDLRHKSANANAISTKISKANKPNNWNSNTLLYQHHRIAIPAPFKTLSNSGIARLKHVVQCSIPTICISMLSLRRRRLRLAEWQSHRVNVHFDVIVNKNDGFLNRDKR